MSDRKYRYKDYTFGPQRVHDNWTYRRNEGGKNKWYLLYIILGDSPFGNSNADSFDSTNSTHGG